MKLDIETLMIVNLMLSVIGSGAMIVIWQQNRNHFSGMFQWFVAMAMLAGSSLLFALRGSIPNFISIVVGNTLIACGVIFLLIGLELFVGHKGPRIPNYILLASFVLSMTYYCLIYPDIAIRSIIFSVMLILLYSQICWLLFRQVTPALARITRIPAIVMSGYIVISVGRIILLLFFPLQTSDFFHAGFVESLPLILYCGISCCLMISLILMVNKRLLQQVSVQEQKYTMAFHSSPYAIMLTRLSDGVIFEVNEGFVHTTGYSYDEVIGKTTHDLGFWVNEEDRTKMIRELSEKQKVREFELQFRKKSGAIFYGVYTANIIEINNEDCILANISDITELSNMKHELQVMATHDELTGLPNRMLLYDRFGTAIANARRNNNAFAVMSVDIDKFKSFNDALGHFMGDNVLVAVARRLSELLRKVDTVARFGGDEFILLLGEVESREDAIRIAKKIHEAFHKPFIIGDREMTLTLSIGVAMFPEDGRDMDDLIKKSDESLYYVKNHGRGNYQFYDQIDKNT